MAKLDKVKAHNLSRIDVNLPEAVLYWCRELGCNEARLLATVREVGSDAAAVRRNITGRWI